MGDTDNHRIQKFTRDGGPVASFGTWGTGNGQFNHPTVVAVDRAGNIFVADYDSSRVQKLSPGDAGPDVGVCDVRGARVLELARGWTCGAFETRAGVARLAPGVCFVEARAGVVRATRRAVILR